MEQQRTGMYENEFFNCHENPMLQDGQLWEVIMQRYEVDKGAYLLSVPCISLDWPASKLLRHARFLCNVDTTDPDEARKIYLSKSVSKERGYERNSQAQVTLVTPISLHCGVSNVHRENLQRGLPGYFQWVANARLTKKTTNDQVDGCQRRVGQMHGSHHSRAYLRATSYSPSHRLNRSIWRARWGKLTCVPLFRPKDKKDNVENLKSGTETKRTKDPSLTATLSEGNIDGPSARSITETTVQPRSTGRILIATSATPTTITESDVRGST
ncbi:hypothetical protein WG66_010590 [Moniliophthora roreri]|nr:hypothetical protein WG66_010590 [Moniliophthora roreri]